MITCAPPAGRIELRRWFRHRGLSGFESAQVSSRYFVRRIGVLWLAAAMMLGIAACRGADAPNFYGSVNEPAIESPALQLLDFNGQPFDLAQERGKVVAIFWGYLSCPDVCPLTLSSLYRVQDSLSPEEREHFQVVMISVDPERDDAVAMRRRLQAIHPDFIGLVGSRAEIDESMRDWGVEVERTDRPEGGYLITHPAQVMLIDPAGRFLVSSHYQSPPDELLADVRGLMRLPAAVDSEPVGDEGVALESGAAFEAAPWPGASDRRGNEADAWLHSFSDGSVWWSEEGSEPEKVLTSWETRQPVERVNVGTELGAPSVAFDPIERRVWYSDTHDAIHSRSIDDGSLGPVLGGFSDTAIPGCGVATSGRVFALDPQRRRLYAPLLTGQILAYDLDTLDVTGSLPAAGFEDLVLGRYRTLAVDPGRGVWVLNEAGAAVEFDPDRSRPTGRRIEAQADGLVVDAGLGLLYMQEGEAWRSVSLETLEPAEGSSSMIAWDTLTHAGSGPELVHLAVIEGEAPKSARQVEP